jgi:hypothetical protein
MAVNDSGSGMHKATMGKIFEPFSMQNLAVKEREVLDAG